MEQIKHAVGVVLPSYNQAEFLERAIQSVLENKKNIDMKLVVMDGGSTDGSREILEKYAAEFDYWQSKADGGQSAAINEGMKLLGDCEYVMWLNSDDVYDSDSAVAQIYACAKKADAALCYGKSHFVDRAGAVIGDYPVPANVPFIRMKQNCAFSQPSVMVKKTVWDEMHGLDRRLAMCMDYDLWVRILQKYPAVYCDAYIGSTRLYEETKSSVGQLRSRLEGVWLQHRSYGHADFRWLCNTFLCERGVETEKISSIKKRLLQATAAVRVRIQCERYENHCISRVEQLMAERAGKL